MYSHQYIYYIAMALNYVRTMFLKNVLNNFRFNIENSKIIRYIEFY